MSELSQNYKDLAIPFFREVFDRVDDVLKERGIPYYLIGVSAIALEMLKKGIKPTRGTKELDPALLREGHLKGIQKFGELPLDNAIQVAQAIGVDIEIDKPMTVAEICNPKVENRNVYSTTVGFN